MKLFYKNTQLVEGDFLTDEMGVEGGIILEISYPEVLVSDCKEGWAISEEDGMGLLEWRAWYHNNELQYNYSMADPNTKEEKERTPEELADYELYLAEMKNELSHYWIPSTDPEDDENLYPSAQ